MIFLHDKLSYIWGSCFSSDYGVHFTVNNIPGLNVNILYFVVFHVTIFCLKCSSNSESDFFAPTGLTDRSFVNNSPSIQGNHK